MKPNCTIVSFQPSNNILFHRKYKKKPGGQILAHVELIF